MLIFIHFAHLYSKIILLKVLNVISATRGLSVKTVQTKHTVDDDPVKYRGVIGVVINVKQPPLPMKIYPM